VNRYVNGEYIAAHPTWHAEDSPYKATQVGMILREAGISPASIVEVGCGAGGVVAALAREFPGAQCRGYEISPDAFRMCGRHALPNLQYILGDYADTEGLADVVVSCDVLEHVEDYLGFIRMLGARSRHVVLNVPMDISVANVLLKRFGYARAKSGHLHYFTKETALASVAQAGLPVTRSFLVPGGIVRAVSLKQKLAAVPRLAMGLFGAEISCRLFGGYSLVLLAKGRVGG